MSDSPTGQYRNRNMFLVIFEKIILLSPCLEMCTWNYTEAGHGKDATDRVGAIIKRQCDRLVANNVNDISSFEKFSLVSLILNPR